MGQIEIGKRGIKNLTPDTITLNIIAEVYKMRVPITNTDFVRDELKVKVTNLVNCIKVLEVAEKIKFSDLKFKEDSCVNKESKGVFSMKAERYVDIRGYVDIDITTHSRDADALNKMMQLLLNDTSLHSVNFDVSVEDMEKSELDLKAEICKKCREEAELIVTSLGSEIIGVSKVIYGSSGRYLSDTSMEKAKTSFNTVGVSDEAFDECVDFETDLSLKVNYNEAWADGFVRSMLDRDVYISDSITVVFDIK